MENDVVLMLKIKKKKGCIRKKNGCKSKARSSSSMAQSAYIGLLLEWVCWLDLEFLLLSDENMLVVI